MAALKVTPAYLDPAAAAAQRQLRAGGDRATRAVNTPPDHTWPWVP